MELLLDIYSKNSELSHLIPFLKTYYMVTKSVAEKGLEYKHYFHDYNAIQKVDVAFAALYFKPVKAYILHDKKDKPWQGYFDYCLNNNIPFLQVLLGINAHINGDLVNTLVQLNYSFEADYNIINQILLELTPALMRYLAFEQRDVFGALGVILQKFIEEEFHNLIVKWRDNAFKNAIFICKKDDKEYYINKVKDETEKVAEKITELFVFNLHNLNPLEFLNQLNSLQVNILK